MTVFQCRLLTKDRRGTLYGKQEIQETIVVQAVVNTDIVMKYIVASSFAGGNASADGITCVVGLCAINIIDKHSDPHARYM